MANDIGTTMSPRSCLQTGIESGGRVADACLTYLCRFHGTFVITAHAHLDPDAVGVVARNLATIAQLTCLLMM